MSQLECCQSNLVEKYGKWVVITGATDGIGLSMAKEFARRGMSVLVVSRNEERLARTKAELEAEPNVGEVETVKIDLGDSSLENFARIRQQIDPENRDIGVLVNNAGTFPSCFKRYNRFDMDGLLNIANLNMIAPLHLTRMIMPGMVKRGKGMVMNVSSILGYITTPYMSIYAPTKAFMNAFTHQLQVEYSGFPIDIFLLTPGPVHTKLFTGTAKLSKPTFINPTPDDYAKSAINATSSRINSYSGTMAHGLINVFGQFFQRIGVNHFIYRINLSLNARHLELSPEPKRRGILVNAASSSRDAANPVTTE